MDRCSGGSTLPRVPAKWGSWQGRCHDHLGRRAIRSKHRPHGWTLAERLEKACGILAPVSSLFTAVGTTRMQYQASTFKTSGPECQSGICWRFWQACRAWKKTVMVWFFFFFFFPAVTHGGVKRLRINWISSTPQCTNQRAVAIKTCDRGSWWWKWVCLMFVLMHE